MQLLLHEAAHSVRAGRSRLSYANIYDHAGMFDGEVCAVKTVSDGLQGYAEATALRMFQREAHMLKDCRHG